MTTKPIQPEYLHNPRFGGEGYSVTERAELVLSADAEAAKAHKRGDHKQATKYERSSRIMRGLPADLPKPAPKPVPTARAVKPTDVYPHALDGVTMKPAKR